MGNFMNDSTQHEIVTPGSIPAAGGLVAEPGWARSEVLSYTRENIHAPWFRRKEWDYYLFTNDTFGVAFTISDLGYIGLLSASFLDFTDGTEHTESDLAVFPRHRVFGLGTAVADANGSCHTKRLDLSFSRVAPGKRHISCDFRNFNGDASLQAELDVYEPAMEQMFIATPWAEKPTAFYYNCKMNCLEAEGTVRYGDRELRMERATSLGVLDWGRGVWTYNNTWYWGTGSGRLAPAVEGEIGEPFGFNLGYGFTDRSSASENVIYYGGRVHKLCDVDFGIPHNTDGSYRFLEPWHITSSDDRFDATFVPLFDRAAAMDYKLILSDQHQVFGRMTGRARTDEGEELEFADFLCALEVVHNKY